MWNFKKFEIKLLIFPGQNYHISIFFIHSVLEYNSFRFFALCCSVTTGDALKQFVLNQQKDIDFDEWLTVDKQLCDLYTQMNRYWTRFLIYSLFYNNFPYDAVAFFEKYMSLTGSTVEFSIICRTLVNEQIYIELYLLYCIGQTNENILSNVSASVKDYHDFCERGQLFAFSKKEQTFAYLCQSATNIDQSTASIDNAANLFFFCFCFDIFDKKIEFVSTETLRKNIAKIAVQGDDNPTNVFISGPSSVTYQSIDE